MKRLSSRPAILLLVALLFCTLSAPAQKVTRLAEGWRFSLGNASDPANDFGRGTEYFNYLTKAASIHNEGPYVLPFDDSAWTPVRVPHDWAAALPYDSLASHSHGYKTVGWKYPETSVGWYRLRLPVSGFREGRHYELRFDGIFRDAEVWFNGIWLGREPSGYAVQVFDITPYIDFAGENLLCVRADATFEEGWFYEGAGIYRPVWLLEKGPVHVTEGGVRTSWEPDDLTVAVEVRNTGAAASTDVRLRLVDAEGKEVSAGTIPCRLRAGETATVYGTLRLEGPRRWDTADPYLYTLETHIGADVYRTTVGIREIAFNATDGFLLNGRKVTLKGVNLHQDHAGVGAAMPAGLIEWRIRELMKYGVNAIRCSHNPASPQLLEICDRLGVLVIDENRLMGMSDYHKRQLENMVRFGAQHPSVILWSVGNEEWGLENDPRGVYVPEPGRMVSLSRTEEPENVIERGWKYYADNPWTAGVFFWTGLDYRGEPNPLKFPAVGSEFGLLDYCGFPKDEAFYLKAWWTDEPVLHVFPHWNPSVVPGSSTVISSTPDVISSEVEKSIDVWVYANCDEVELRLNGRSLGRKAMPRNGHLVWEDVRYAPGKLVATGFVAGRRISREVLETTGPAVTAALSADVIPSDDGESLAVITVRLVDARGRFVPDARNALRFNWSGPGRILGGGNGDPAWLGIDVASDPAAFQLPAFNGLAQLLIEIPASATFDLAALTVTLD